VGIYERRDTNYNVEMCGFADVEMWEYEIRLKYERRNTKYEIRNLFSGER